MTRGGARVGAGRKPSAEQALVRLDKLKAEVHLGLQLSAGEMARSMPDLTRIAIETAKAGNMGMLRFVIDLFWKLALVLPAESEDSPTRRVYERIQRIVDEYTSNRPTIVDTREPGDTGGVEARADPSDGSAVLG